MKEPGYEAIFYSDLARFATHKLLVPVRKRLKRQRYFNSTFLAVQSSAYSYTSLQYDSAISGGLCLHICQSTGISVLSVRN